ncbi:MAG: hypothetical protein HQL32_13085 [Planctomycetes bacterium]|nr:hypothetical protein [Planctomycetota bacterium]
MGMEWEQFSQILYLLIIFLAPAIINIFKRFKGQDEDETDQRPKNSQKKKSPIGSIEELLRSQGLTLNTESQSADQGQKTSQHQGHSQQEHNTSQQEGAARQAQSHSAKTSPKWKSQASTRKSKQLSEPSPVKSRALNTLAEAKEERLRKADAQPEGARASTALGRLRQEEGRVLREHEESLLANVDSASMKEKMIWREILGPPKALEPGA